MKRFFTVILAIFALTLNAAAENVIIGDKLPDMSIKKWLMDTQPSDAEYTCILFFHSKSDLCQKTLSKLKRYTKQWGEKLNLIIITKENYSEVGVSLTQHLDERIGVAFDDNGRTFRYFGVKFIPYCVISQKKRVEWCGNGALLNDKTLENILTSK